MTKDLRTWLGIGLVAGVWICVVGGIYALVGLEGLVFVAATVVAGVALGFATAWACDVLTK